MKLKFLRMKKTLLVPALFLFLFPLKNIFGQHNAVPGIDVSHFSSIYFDPANRNAETMDLINRRHHEDLLKRDPQWDLKRAQYEYQLQHKISGSRINSSAQSVVTIPVVVHIVYNTPVQNISDNTVYSQMIVLNEDFSRTAADTSNTPAPFAAVAGNPGIQFCLAQRDPAGNPTTGIERRYTTQTMWNNDDMKFYASGGLDCWDPTRYLNIWVCYTGGVCWGEFPTATPSNTFGVVMNYFYFGSNYTSYGIFPQINNYLDYGEICVHEIGHCLNLYHIWGDDNGSCTGTDYCADTPNQADASSACMTFPHTDACTTSGNGIMFENYMDYTDDDCLNLFTLGQCARMNAVLTSAPYNSLTTSNGCQSVPQYMDDASILSILSPGPNTCSSVTPVVVLKNWGLDTIFSCNINYFADANTPSVYNWTGALPPLSSDTITFSPLTFTPGNHTFTAFTSLPNGNTDGQPNNDQRVNSFVWLGTGTSLPFFQGFEFATFPPSGWTLSNADGSNTWARTSLAAHTGNASAMMDNIGYYNGYGLMDELTMPTINLNAVPNPVFAFDVAYTYYHQTNPVRDYTDTLSIFISTDCGQTYSLIFKKGGAQLSTVAPGNNDPAFVPAHDQWRTEYIPLQSYQFCDNAIFMIRNTSGWGNEMYLDNINIDDALGIAQEKNQNGFDLFPNPASDKIFIDLQLEHPQNISLNILDLSGKIISAQTYVNAASGEFTIDSSELADGIYFVEVVTADNLLIKKCIITNK
jgi:hypothetical protein